MTKRLLLSLLVASTLISSGCAFWTKSHREKANPKIATQTEIEFQRRWMNQRLSELAKQGVTGPAAREQASREFQAKFPFAVPGK